MSDNYIRVGHPLNMHFIFFRKEDMASVEMAKQKLVDLKQKEVHGPTAIWEASPHFPGLPVVGGKPRQSL